MRRVAPLALLLFVLVLVHFVLVVLVLVLVLVLVVLVFLLLPKTRHRCLHRPIPRHSHARHLHPLPAGGDFPARSQQRQPQAGHAPVIAAEPARAQ